MHRQTRQQQTSENPALSSSNNNDGSSNGCGQSSASNSLAQGMNDSNSSAGKRFKQPEKVSFMEHNRLRNMAISLRKLSIPTDQLVKTVNRLDIDQLSLDSIEILLRMVPTQQEIKAYKEYEQQQGGQLEALTDEDRFLCLMSKIDRLEQKIKIMFYMKNLEITQPHGTNTSLSSSYSISSSNTDSGDLLASTKAKIEYVETAAKSLRNSDGIRILLEYILVFGNYLNSSSRSLASAPAYGFKLQALDMVTEAKSTQDKSRNLLHFIVDTIMKNLNSKEKAKLANLTSVEQQQLSIGGSGRTNNPMSKRVSPLGTLDSDSVKMPYDFDNLMVELEQAATVSLETLLCEVKEFEKGIELCIKELHVRISAAEALENSTTSGSGAISPINSSSSDQLSKTNNITTSHHQQAGNGSIDNYDETIKRLQKFIKSRSCDIIEIKETIQRAQKEFNECAQYFGENPRTIESSSLFSVFLRHLKNFKQCQLDNKLIEKRKFDEELRKQIQQQQALRAAKKKLLNNNEASLISANNRTQNNTDADEVSSSRQQHKLNTSSCGPGNNADNADLKENRLLHQDEVSHGTLDILITGLKVEPYRRADGARKSIRRLERTNNNKISEQIMPRT